MHVKVLPFPYDIYDFRYDIYDFRYDIYDFRSMDAAWKKWEVKMDRL